MGLTYDAHDRITADHIEQSKQHNGNHRGACKKRTSTLPSSICVHRGRAHESKGVEEWSGRTVDTNAILEGGWVLADVRVRRV